jgi:hypothetical protein
MRYKDPLNIISKEWVIDISVGALLQNQMLAEL